MCILDISACESGRKESTKRDSQRMRERKIYIYIYREREREREREKEKICIYVPVYGCISVELHPRTRIYTHAHVHTRPHIRIYPQMFYPRVVSQGEAMLIHMNMHR